jgi:hypothetical protein
MYRYLQRYIQDAFTMATPPFYISKAGHGNERNPGIRGDHFGVLVPKENS